MSKITYLIKHSGIYSISQVLARLSGFFLMYIITDTRYVSHAEYAGYNFFISACTLSSIIFSVGMESALVRNLKMEPENRSKIVNSAISILFFSLSVFLFLSLFFKQQVAEHIFQDASLYQLAYCMAAVVVFDVFSNFPIHYYRAEERPGIFTFYKLMRFVLELSLIFIGIRYLDMGIVGGGIGLATAAFLNFLIVSPFYFKHFKITFDKQYIEKMLRFGFPLLVNAALYLCIELADRYFIDIFVNKEATGAYLTMYKFGAILTVLNGSFRSAWHPIMLREAKENNKTDYFAKVLSYFMILSSCIMVFASLLAIDFVQYNPFAFIRNLVRDPIYFQNANLLSLILMGYVFLGIYYNLSLAFYVKEKSINFAIFSFVGIIVNLAINCFIIIYPSEYGVIAASATCVSYFIMAMMSYYKSQKIYPVTYEKRKILWIFLYMLFVTFITVGFPDLDIWKKLLIAVFYPIYLVVFKVVNLNDLKKMKSYRNRNA
jgi:O-antigen/teichoic acid export membrane protein